VPLSTTELASVHIRSDDKYRRGFARCALQG
jgi:hypothetical protein